MPIFEQRAEGSTERFLVDEVVFAERVGDGEGLAGALVVAEAVDDGVEENDPARVVHQLALRAHAVLDDGIESMAMMEYGSAL